MKANRSVLLSYFFFSLLITREIQALDAASLLKPAETMLKNEDGIGCLGWSKAGSCAFIARVDGGMRGGYALRLLVLDTVEDTILFDEAAWVDELGIESEKPGDILAALAESNFGADFAAACDLAKIVAGTAGGQLKLFPLRALGTSFSAIMVSAKSKEPLDESQKTDAEYGAQKLDIQVIVRREGKGSKQITALKGVMASSLRVIGYFLSPFESRILVVYERSTPGFEGEPHSVPGFAGCHLDRGFTTP